MRAEDRGVLLLGNRYISDLLLAATGHVVVLPSVIVVLAFATVEFVWLGVLASAIVLDRIVAIPTVDDVRARACPNAIIAVTPVDDVIAMIANQKGVVARPAVDDVFAASSE